MVSRNKMTMTFLTILMTFLIHDDNVALETKTTALVANAAGKCAPPAAAVLHVVMTMGSVSRVAIDHSVNKVMNKVNYPETIPNWVEDLSGRLSKNLKEIIETGLVVV